MNLLHSDDPAILSALRCQGGVVHVIRWTTALRHFLFTVILAFATGEAFAVDTHAESVSASQDLELQLIRTAGEWNAFEGPKIESELRKNKALWRAVMLSRAHKPLIQLRDLQHGIVNADNIYILVEPGKAKELERLARSWSASEIGWLNAEEAFEAMGTGLNKGDHPWKVDPKRVILQLWWH